MRSSRERKARRVRSMIVGGAALLLVLSTMASPASAYGTRTVSGTVACLYGNKVVGIWVHSTNGGGGWATWTARSGAAWIADYSYVVTTSTSSTSIRLDVGCSGSSTEWWSNNRTPLKSVTGSTTLNAVCREKAGTGERCVWWNNTALVGMPMSGYFDRFGLASPSSHETVGSWATDLYQSAGTSVRAYVWAPRGVSLTLTVNRTSQLWCYSSQTGERVSGGTTVFVDVKWNGSKIGWLSYGHLASVPSTIVAGASITAGVTTLGRLYMWENSTLTAGGTKPCWGVTSSTGVHTHHAEANYASGYACYRPGISGKYVTAGQWIGSVGSTTATSSNKSCG